MLKRYMRGIGKKYCVYKVEEEWKMGVSMGVVKPIKGAAAKALLEDLKKTSIDDKVLEQCKRIGSLISRK